MPIRPFKAKPGIQWKFYVLFWNQSKNEIIFPIKKTHNAFDGRQQYAGGYPSFFGGNLKTDVLNTLIEEVKEESCETYSIEGSKGNNFDFLISGLNIRENGGIDSMHFYTTGIFQQTDVLWPNYQYPGHKAPKRDYGEMDEIVTVNLRHFENISSTISPKDILEILINVCVSNKGSNKQYQDFLKSETGKAFVQFIKSKISPRNRAS
ncbi:MAG: hypothetical protein AB4038_15370 [Prochloraceae cyanobacterium]